MCIPEEEFIELEKQMDNEKVTIEEGLMILKQLLWEIGYRYDYKGDEVFKQLIAWKSGKII